MKIENKNKSDSLIDNMVSSLKIHEELDKKLVKRLKLMPYLKKVYEFVAKDETSKEAEYFCDGFVEGADWRINSVWHDVKDIPKESSAILAIRSDGSTEIVYFINLLRWRSLIKRCGFVQWAYIKDLTPNKEVEQ